MIEDLDVAIGAAIVAISRNGAIEIGAAALQ